MQNSQRLNVLVYSGQGSSPQSVQHALFTLRRLLSPRYAVSTVTGDAIIKDPWISSCALLIMPGGADMGYCSVLNGAGNRKIEHFVQQGGAYIGFCAGGYYGSSKCEFEVGDKDMQVIGDRELAFFPGTCRGCAFKGYKYDSEAGARAVHLKVNDAGFLGNAPEAFRSYYNGGGLFVDAPKFRENGVEVLASYTENLDIDSGEGTAAIVYCKVGSGAAMLTGPHPEFASRNIEPKQDIPFFPEVVETLENNDDLRNSFMKACLKKLGLIIDQGAENVVPPLSRLHLSSSRPGEIDRLLTDLKEIITIDNGKEYIKDENDTFLLEKSMSLSLPDLSQISLETEQAQVGGDSITDNVDRIRDYSAIIKHIVTYEEHWPASRVTPSFSHDTYFEALAEIQAHTLDAHSSFGSTLLYGDVVTSTNTLLEKNTQTLRRLPSGFTACATRQVAGRGRGSNVWISPPGSLMFSVLFHHPVSIMSRAPIVFLQYIAALAIIESIHSYDKGYESLQIKLKWPNDIYASNPNKTNPTDPSYVKIGGILINSHYSSTTYHSVLGIGLNLSNSAPTISLQNLISHLPPQPNPSLSLAPLTPERLLARLVTTLSAFYTRFCTSGFKGYFEKLYYKHWLHSEQVVTLETEGGLRARIKGISTDWGQLVAEEILGGDGVERERAGRRIELLSDGNSFDFFRGLIRKKT